MQVSEQDAVPESAARWEALAAVAACGCPEEVTAPGFGPVRDRPGRTGSARAGAGRVARTVVQPGAGLGAIAARDSLADALNRVPRQRGSAVSGGAPVSARTPVGAGAR